MRPFRKDVFLFYFAVMTNNDEKISLCALGRIFGFEPKIALELISRAGSASEIFRLGNKELDSLLGPYSRHRRKITRQAFDEAALSLEKLAEDGIRFTGWTEDGYPPLLRECPDAPAGLYIRSSGRDDDLWKGTAISIVGTRDISPYGREWCEKLVAALADANPGTCIISGLAIGTDICAHIGAVQYGLPTIAVMATGPDRIYPHRHTDFARKIAGTADCALVTDFPPGTAPLPVNFLRRNRIIAGLGRAAVIIESKIKGGAMMTARLAFSYDREVYALPGRADDIRSRGCNCLIKERIAEVLTSPEELAESLGFRKMEKAVSFSDPEIICAAYRGSMAEEDIGLMQKMVSAIRSERGISIGQVAETAGIDYGRAAAIAGILEADGFITTDLLRRCFLVQRRFR